MVLYLIFFFSFLLKSFIICGFQIRLKLHPQVFRLVDFILYVNYLFLGDVHFLLAQLCCFLVRREQRCLCSSTSFTGIRCLKRLSTIFMLRCCQEVDLTPLMLGTFAVKLAAPENVIRHTFVLTTVTPLFTFYFYCFLLQFGERNMR